MEIYRRMGLSKKIRAGGRSIPAHSDGCLCSLGSCAPTAAAIAVSVRCRSGGGHPCHL
jgi:hypothetical protein